MGLDETSPVLDALGALAPFELAVGANGRVWLSSSSAAMVARNWRGRCSLDEAVRRGQECGLLLEKGGGPAEDLR